MDDMQNQMNAILGNPEMMEKIMAMAQSLGQSQVEMPTSEPPKQNPGGFALPDIDLSLVQKLSALAGQSHIDSNQQTLLNALMPYLSRERVTKLEKAMRAARMASVASSFLGSSGLF